MPLTKVSKMRIQVSVAVEFELTRQLARADKRVGQLDRPSRVELQLASRTSLDRVSCFHVPILILNEKFKIVTYLSYDSVKV